MPHALIANYLDHAEMEAAHVAASAEITAVGCDTLSAHLVRLELEQLWVTRVDELGTRIKHVALNPQRMFLTFDTAPSPPRLLEGMEMPAKGLMCHGIGSSYYELARGEAHWGTVSMPVGMLSSATEKMGLREFTPPRSSVVSTPSPENLERFQRLHAAAGALAESAPQIITHPEAARGLEQAFVDAIIPCLDSGESESPSWAQQCHSIIMRRFRRVLEDNPARAIYVPEMCVAIGVPERTLRLCCQEALGMSPKRYLTLRRMNFARRALLSSFPGATTVTDIATRFGFWHFGRFSTVYRSLFNELPSDTLRRAADSRACQHAVWLLAFGAVLRFVSFAVQ